MPDPMRLRGGGPKARTFAPPSIPARGSLRARVEHDDWRERTMAEEFPAARELMYLTMAEAAALLAEITGGEVTPQLYAARCASGELERLGVNLLAGGEGKWLTDLDSLLAYLDRDISRQYERIKEALEERRFELEGC
jgi:hypothetical protein